jgi:hypothetical protein
VIHSWRVILAVLLPLSRAVPTSAGLVCDTTMH